MKIRLRQLKQLIREVAISPSLRNNEPMNGPFDSKGFSEAFQKLETAFESALSLDLVVRALDDHYNPETREFDDEVYHNIKKIVGSAKKRAFEVVKNSLQTTWAEVHGSGKSKSPPPLKAA